MHKKMRIYHRYLGFFLVGIMAVYAISGLTLIFRDKDIFKKSTEVTKVLPAGTRPKEVGKALKIKRFKIDRVEDGIAYFRDGTYNLQTHTVNYTKKELPYVLEKMTQLHKSSSSKPLAFLNVFFALSLLFFVVSSFWMFMPKTSIFKKGLYFSLAGLVLALVLILV